MKKRQKTEHAKPRLSVFCHTEAAAKAAEYTEHKNTNNKKFDFSPTVAWGSSLLATRSRFEGSGRAREVEGRNECTYLARHACEGELQRCRDGWGEERRNPNPRAAAMASLRFVVVEQERMGMMTMMAGINYFLFYFILVGFL
jgi:hypothetical protein